MPDAFLDDELVNRHFQSFLSLMQAYHPVLFTLVSADVEVMYASINKQAIQLHGIGWGIPDLYMGRDAAWRLCLAASTAHAPDTARIFYGLYVDFLQMLQEGRSCQ